jgi:hypothetical protein
MIINVQIAKTCDDLVQVRIKSLKQEIQETTILILQKLFKKLKKRYLKKQFVY